MEEIKCPRCRAKLHFEVIAYDSTMTQTEEYEKKIGELQIRCAQLNDEKQDIMARQKKESSATLDSIHALHGCAVSEIQKLVKKGTVEKLNKAHELAEALSMIIPDNLPKGVQESMTDQRFRLMVMIKDKIREIEKPQKWMKEKIKKRKKK